jgi:hypothetical protein
VEDGSPIAQEGGRSLKHVVKFYESKQYKKGIKSADAILKRFPNHGETLCMKGLIVNAMANAFFVPQQQQQQGSDGDGGVDKKKEAVVFQYCVARYLIVWPFLGALPFSTVLQSECKRSCSRKARQSFHNLLKIVFHT